MLSIVFLIIGDFDYKVVILAIIIIIILIICTAIGIKDCCNGYINIEKCFSFYKYNC